MSKIFRWMLMLGSVIKKYRLSNQVDQRDLANLLGVSQAQMSRIESDLVALTMDQIFLVADFFSTPELLLLYIQPYLDHALEMNGTMKEAPEKCLLTLMTESLNRISAGIETHDTKSVDDAASQLISLAQIVRVLVKN